MIMFETINLKKDGIYDAYLRKSRADLSLESTKKIDTLRQHEEFIKKRAKQLNISIRTWYKEVVSGDTIADRPEMQRLLKSVESGIIDGIIVVDIDRLARGDTTDQGIVARTFKYTDTKIITLMKIYDPNNEDDEDFFEFNLFMARKEYKQIKKRLQRGRLSSVLAGKYCGSIAPYGYNKVKIQNDKGFTLAINQEEDKTKKIIYRKRAAGMGWNIICNYLNDSGIPPRKGDVWTPSTLKDIVANPVNIGKIRWNYNKLIKYMKNGEVKKRRKKSNKQDIILVEGLHPASIDEETFYAANSIKINNSSVRYDKTMKNPLSGLVSCSACGRKMIRRPFSSKHTKRAKNPLNKEKLLQCLRTHKKDYSLNTIARKLNYTKYTVTNWFPANINRFVVPPIEAWYKLKIILDIETKEFDQDIELYHTKKIKINDSLMCPKAHCITVASQLELVENKIIEITKNHLLEKKLIIENYPKNNDFNDENIDKIILELKKKIKNLEQQLDKAYELVENNVYTAEEFTKRTKKIKSNIEFNKKELKKINNAQNKKDFEQLIAIADEVINNYYQIKSVEEKNILLKSIINNVEYIKIKGGKKNFNDFTLKIDFKF